MEVELKVEDHRGGRARCGHASLLRSPLGVLAVLIFCLSWAEAQDASASKPGEAKAAGASVEKTRSRRVVETPDATGDGAAKSDGATKSDGVAKSDEDDSVDSPPRNVGTGGDRVATLRTQIEAAKTDAERTRLQRLLIDYLVALGKKSEAVGELRVMSRAERLDPIGFYNIGNALARLGDTDTAIDAYRKAINQRHGNYARAHNNMGVMFLRQGRWDEAQEAFTSALRLENFRYAEASYNLGRVYSALGEADLAIREWTRALAVEPAHADAAISLARAYAEDGSPERGLEVLDGFVAHHGPSAELAAARREILFGSDTGVGATLPNAAPDVGITGPAKTTNSNKTLTSVKSPESSVPKTLSEKSSGGKRASAAASLRSLTVNRESYDLLQRARTAREGGRYEEAAKFYQRVLSRESGFFPPANLELSFVLSRLKRYEEAAETLSVVAKREGARYPIAYFYLGRQYESLGRFGLAAEAFEKAAAAYGDTNPQFLLDLSRVREKEGNARAALDAMESYVRISQTLGRVPDWSDERLAQLRLKASQK
jgi:tetratricopeptide (TPR) repeat protein